MHTSLRFYATAAPLCVLLALTACSKHDDAYPAPPIVASWVIDNQERTSIFARTDVSNDRVDMYIYQNFETPNSKGSVTTVTLIFPKKLGTYAVSFNSKATATFVDFDTSTGLNRDVYDAEDGSITVSTLTNTSIAGTFTLTGQGRLNKQLTKSLTNGKFKASF